MLQSFRKAAETRAMKALMILLAASFVGWGVGDYLIGGQTSTALEVNGEPVSAQRLQRAFQSRVRDFENQFGDQFDPKMLEDANFGNQVVAALAQQTLVEQAARNMGLHVSDEQLRNTLKQFPVYQDNDGNFDPELYRNTLRTRGYSVEGFEERLRQQHLRQMVDRMFKVVYLNDSKTVKRFLQTENTRISIDVLPLQLEDVRLDKPITQEDLQAFYEENKEQFMVPQKRSVHIIKLDANTIAPSIDITDEQARNFYTENLERWEGKETRKARHILVDNLEKAEALVTQLKNGADFARLAQEASKDTLTAEKGGDLGFFAHGEMVSSFADAAFSLQQGVVSDPVKSPFGYHVIQVTDIRKPKNKSFAEVRTQIVTELQTQQAEGALYNTLADIEDMLAGGNSFAQIAQNLPYVEMETYTDLEQGAGSNIAPEIIQEAFELAEGEVSESIETSPQQTVFVQVNKITPATPIAFAKIEKQLAKLAVEARKKEKMRAMGIEAVSKARDENLALSDIKQTYNLASEIRSFSNIQRNGTNAPYWLNEQAMRQAFQASEGEVMPGLLATPDKEYLMVQISEKSVPNVNLNAQQMKQTKHNFSQAFSHDLRWQYLNYLNQRADIEYNMPVLLRILGPTFKPARM